MAEIAALQRFVKDNERDLSGSSGDGGIVNRRRNEATMELEKKSEELAKNLEAKEKEFQVCVGIPFLRKIIHRLSSACGRGFVCFVFGLCTMARSKTKHTKILPHADKRRCR